MKKKIIIISVICVIICFIFGFLVFKKQAKNPIYKPEVSDNYCRQENASERVKCLMKVDEIPSLKLTSEKEIDYTYHKWNKNISVELDDEKLPEAKIKTRGNTTYTAGTIYGAYNYKIKFDKAVDLFGFGKSDKWVLLPNLIDYSNIRQFYFSNLAQVIMGDYWSPQMKYVELYINDEYRGLYLVAESIEETENRLNLTDNSFIAQLEQGRLWRLWQETEDEYFLIDDEAKPCSNYEQLKGAEKHKTMYTLEYPESFSDISKERGDEIKNSVNDLMNSAREHKPFDLLNLDVDSAVNFYLFDELFYNSGMGSSSVYMYQYENSPITLGPLWDFDQLTLENVGEGFVRPGTCDNNLYRYLLRYPEFREKLKTKLEWFKNEVAPTAKQELDNLQNNKILRAAIERNQTLHPTWGKKADGVNVWQNEKIIELKNWDEHVNWIREILYTGRTWEGKKYQGRVDWLLEHFDEIK